MSRVRVEPGCIRGWGRSSNHSGDDGGTRTGIRSEVQWMSGWELNVGSKTRNATWYRRWRGHGETAMEVPRTMAGTILRPVNGVNNVTTWRGDVIVGTIPANGQGNSTKTRHATKNAVVKKHSDGPTQSVQFRTGGSAGPTAKNADLLPTAVATSWWGRSPGNMGTRRIHVGNAKAKQKKNKRRLSTVINWLWNEHSGGNTNRGDGSEMVSGLAKEERQLEPYGSSERKQNMSYEKSGITMARRPCEDGDQWNP